MVKIIYQSRVYRPDLVYNRNLLYVFGDNTKRIGLGGQAREMRGEPNAHGIATLWEPGKPFQDKDFQKVTDIMKADISALASKCENYEAIVFPIDGIGTGLALLKEEAPMAFDFLNRVLKGAFGIENPRLKVPA